MAFPHVVLARVYEHIEPLDRGERYEDPLQVVLEETKKGPEETGLFFFGPEADAMFARVEPVLRKLPIGQNARVVVRHGKKELNPTEVRMPRH